MTREKPEIGQIVRAHFTYTKRGHKVGIDAVVTIRDIDGKYLLVVDNDNFPYLVRRDNFEWCHPEKLENN